MSTVKIFHIASFRRLVEVLLFFALAIFFFGIYYVEYEGFMEALISGSLTPGVSFDSIHFIGHIGLSYFYSALTQWMPSVVWLSCFLMLYLFIACYLCFSLIDSLLPNKLPYWLEFLVKLLVFILLFADQSIHFIYTRIAYMLCGISLISILVWFKEAKNIKKNIWLFVFLNALFGIGALTRVEAATATILLLVCFGAYYLRNIKNVIVLLLFPIIMTSSIVISISFWIKTSTEYYIQVEPDIEAQFVDRGNKRSLSEMKNHRDSIQYTAATNLMWSDPRRISASYLRSLIIPEKFLFTDKKQWLRTYHSIKDVIIRFWFTAFLLLLLGAYLSLKSFALKNYVSFLLLLGFLSSFWILIIIQTYVFKLNDRSYSPLVAIFILCHLILIFSHLKSNINMIGLLLIIPAIFQCKYLFSESGKLKSELSVYRQNVNQIIGYAQNKYLILNSSSYDFLFLSNSPFYPFNFSYFKNIYITDGYIIPFLPHYSAFLKQQCNCNLEQFPSFWEYLAKKQNDVIIVSSIQRIEIIDNYLKTFYSLNMNFKQKPLSKLSSIRKSDAWDTSDDLHIFTIQPQLK